MGEAFKLDAAMTRKRGSSGDHFYAFLDADAVLFVDCIQAS